MTLAGVLRRQHTCVFLDHSVIPKQCQAQSLPQLICNDLDHFHFETRSCMRMNKLKKKKPENGDAQASLDNMQSPGQLRASASCSTMVDTMQTRLTCMQACMHKCTSCAGIWMPCRSQCAVPSHNTCLVQLDTHSNMQAVPSRLQAPTEFTCRLLLGLVVRLQVVSVRQRLQAVKRKNLGQPCCLCCYSRQIGDGLPLSHMHLHTNYL